MGFFITFIGTLSPLNLGFIFRFVFFSVQYLYFCLRLWNLACEILVLVLFISDLLCSQYFCFFGCGTLPVRYLSLCCFFSIFSAGYISVVFGCGTLPLRYLALCCLFSIFSIRYHYFVFGCGTLPVRYLALCCFFSIFSLCNLSDDIDLVLFLFDLLCAISLCGIQLLKFACQIVVDLVLFFFHLLYAKSFCCPRLLNLDCGMS